MNWTHWYKGDRVRVECYGPKDEDGVRLALIEHETPQPVLVIPVVFHTPSTPRPLHLNHGQYEVVPETELTPL